MRASLEQNWMLPTQFRVQSTGRRRRYCPSATLTGVRRPVQERVVWKAVWICLPTSGRTTTNFVQQVQIELLQCLCCSYLVNDWQSARAFHRTLYPYSCNDCITDIDTKQIVISGMRTNIQNCKKPVSWTENWLNQGWMYAMSCMVWDI
jgi:hypothetical protein